MSKRIHFIGIGGIGMSGIAQLCLKKGYKVSGSDINESDSTQNLARLGADIHIGHSRECIKDKDLIVYSSAITSENCELDEAIRKKIAVVKRAELLASLMDKQTVIAVTGAHGKTTTSSLAAHLLNEANLSPTIAVGGIVNNISNNAKLGLGKYFVAEADESDGSFLFYKPDYSIITNIDYEHLDFYQTFENVREAFKKFILNTQKDGCVFWCFDDKELYNIIKDIKKRNISFGLDEKADIYASNIKFDSFSSQFDVFYKNKFVDKFGLSIAGRHNISNSLSVIALGLELKLDEGLIKKALKSFSGAKRRFQVEYNQDDILVINDYAHHPTEIRATIETAKRLNKKRLVVVFQPHRYTRMKYLLEKFSKSFFDADYLFITDIYSAGETKIDGVDVANLYNIMNKFAKPQTRFADRNMLVTEVLNFVQKGDLLLFLGAGDINKICYGLVRELKRKSKV
ncbi:MAG: UDP-N-acetylmuramate--L-alanine ligase [Candidatus Omnitrophica bacterium]|nr:UDP-N-acetylmuramate--L-alanine ligase [Candidatus Omnitrophota bacterium]